MTIVQWCVTINIILNYTMPYCYSPWSNIDIAPTGLIAPCCKFNASAYDHAPLNIQSSTLAEYQSSAMLAEVKHEFAQQQWPKGCDRCRIEEENNIKSKRQLDQERWQSHYNDYNIADAKFITASIAFGNTCNLKCITCSPRASSKWQQEYRQVYNIDIKPNHFYKTGFVDELVAQAPDLIHIDIPGGEPLISGVDLQEKILAHYIHTGRAKDMTLHYTTNATMFPTNQWWELWSHFKEVDLQLSVDGVAHRYEYIRYPADWPRVVTNINQYIPRQSSNFRLSVSTTVSAFNIYYLDEFVTWALDQGLPEPWLGRVHNPAHFRPSVWPEPARQHIVNKLASSTHSSVQLWSGLIANTDDSKHFDKFLKYTRAHDQIRGLDFGTTFPEMAPYI